MPLAFRDRFALLLQREVGRLLGPIWIPIGAAVLRWRYGWRVVDAGPARREFARLRRESSTPLLVCANHLTMVDSFMIAMALGSQWWFVTHYGALPWNTPERDNFSRTWWLRVAIWVMKCIPVERGGDRREVGRTLDRFGYVLARGDVEAALAAAAAGAALKLAGAAAAVALIGVGGYIWLANEAPPAARAPATSG